MRNDKRELIINSAAAIFARDGFEKTKMEDISQKAGIGKGTLYEYFKSKKDLFQEVVKHAVDMYIKLLHDVEIEDRPFREKLFDFLMLHEELLNKHKALSQLIIKEPRDIAEGTRRYFYSVKGKVIEIIKNMLDSAIKKGEIREDLDTMVCATMIIGITASLLSVRLYSDSIDDKSYYQALNILLYGIANK